MQKAERKLSEFYQKNSIFHLTLEQIIDSLNITDIRYNSKIKDNASMFFDEKTQGRIIEYKTTTGSYVTRFNIAHECSHLIDDKKAG